MYKLNIANEKIGFFERKYKEPFELFEKEILSEEEESFDKWDDYIEWKAFGDYKGELETKIRMVKSGNFKIS